MVERTLLIIKPDATERGLVGSILERVEKEGFLLRAMGLSRLTRAQAEGFYEVHRGKPFFPGLVEYMISGPVVVVTLERENAILALRKVVGATDPREAGEGTIRRAFGLDVRRNAVHASDSVSSATQELAYFFEGMTEEGAGEGSVRLRSGFRA